MKKTGKETVFIVDDRPENLDVLVINFDKAGFAIMASLDSSEVVPLAEKYRPDMILLDVLMPGTDGFEVCRQLKAKPETSDIPVIFMTSLTDTVDKVRGFEVGGVDYITKPLHPEEVMARVNTHLRLRQIQTELEEKNARLLKSIEEHKQTAAALALSKSRFREMFMSHSAPMLLISPETGRIVDANPAASLFYGHTSEELKSLKMNEINPSAPDRTDSEFLPLTPNPGPRAKPKGTPPVSSHRLKNGDIRTVEVHSSPVEIDGSILLFSIIHDITERAETENALRESQKSLEHAQRIAHIGSWEIDLTANKAKCSQEVCRIFGIVPEAFDQRFDMVMEHLIHPDDRMLLKETYQRLLDEGRKTFAEYRIVRPDGTVMVTWNESEIIFNEAGEAVKIVGIVQDITERARAEEKLRNYAAELETAKKQAEAANFAKSEFLANMSHEIRTPMNAILGFSEILLSKVQDPRHKNYLKTVISSGHSLLTILNDVLDLSKIEAGKMDMRYEPVSVKRIINDIREFFLPKAQEKQIEIRIDISRKIPEYLILDEVRLRQILINLIGNAVKFTHQGYVSLSLYGDFADEMKSRFDLTADVADTGIGIPKDQQYLIFESFKQQEGHNTAKYGGSGLGLAITRRLAEMMHGSVSVQSEAGRGSIFRLVLPDLRIAGQPDISAKKKYPERIDIRFDPATVMIVDDVDYNRDLVCGYLEKSGISLIEAYDGEKALELLGGKKADLNLPDLILMDLKMPGKDGYEITRTIRKNEKLKHIPVIALTAFASKETEEKVKLLFDGYLTKPVNKSLLTAELKKFLSHKEIKSENTGPEIPDDAAEAVFSETSRASLPEMIALLDKEFVPRWEDIREMFFIDDVENFASDLKQAALKYDCPFLRCYSEKLHEQTRLNNIDEVDIIMKAFPDIVGKIRDAV